MSKSWSAPAPTIISGEGLIATAGAIDTHVHLLSPRIMEASLASGVTTIIGQEFGPVWGVGVNSPWALRHAFNSFDPWPVNIGFLGSRLVVATRRR